MRIERIGVLVIGFFFLTCSGRQPGGGTRVSSTDSVRVADSAAAPVPLRVFSYEERQGEVIYMKFCSVCHGQEGKGDGFNAYNLNPRPRDFSDSAYMKALGDEQIVQTITGGGRSSNKSQLMPAYGQTLTREQIRYVEAFVRTFSRP